MKGDLQHRQLDEFDASEALSHTWWSIELDEKTAEIQELETQIDKLTKQRDAWADKYLKILLHDKRSNFNFSS